MPVSAPDEEAPSTKRSTSACRPEVRHPNPLLDGYPTAWALRSAWAIGPTAHARIAAGLGRVSTPPAPGLALGASG
jgi:hypothetical protein